MRVILYDRGSPKGKKLFQDLQEVLKTLQIQDDPILETNMQRAYSMGGKGNTILTINNEIVLVDRFPSIPELSDIISDYL